jgi:plasmid maintenance system antidote protein VapI
MKIVNQYKIAEWLGVKPSTLSNIFCGNRRPSRVEALRLAKITGVSFEDWMLADGQQLRKKVFIAFSMESREVKT